MNIQVLCFALSTEIQQGILKQLPFTNVKCGLSASSRYCRYICTVSAHFIQKICRPTYVVSQKGNDRKSLLSFQRWYACCISFVSFPRNMREKTERPHFDTVVHVGYFLSETAFSTYSEVAIYKPCMHAMCLNSHRMCYDATIAQSLYCICRGWKYG